MIYYDDLLAGEIACPVQLFEGANDGYIREHSFYFSKYGNLFEGAKTSEIPCFRNQWVYLLEELFEILLRIIIIRRDSEYTNKIQANR